MRIRKYHDAYSRRQFMQRLGQGVLATGVLMPLWKAIAADGDITAARRAGAGHAGDQRRADTV